MSNALVPADASGAFKLAEMMSTGKLVPSHLQRSPGDCLMVIEQAMRWGMSPFAVAQCTSVIQGKLMFEGKLVAAALQSSGILDGRLKYDFRGEGDARTITVIGTIRGENEPRTISLCMKDAKTSNGMWTKQPDQQLVYAGTRVWGRRHAPEVMLGVYSPEEMETEAPKDTFKGTTIEAEPVRAPEPINTAPPAPKETPAERAAQLISEITATETEEACEAYAARCSKAIAYLAGIGLQDLADEIADTFLRHKQMLRGEEASA